MTDLACTCEVEGRKDCPACAAHDESKRADRWRARIDGSGMPSALRGKSFLAFEEGNAKAAAQRWASGEMKGLCLTGDVGRAKTWLAATAAWEMLRSRPLLWVSTARMMSQLRSGFGSEQKKQADRIVTGVGPIILDDLDSASPSDFGREAVFAAIDNRYAEGSPILITTNKALSQIGDLYGVKVASRLAEYCEVVRMGGPDLRLA